MSNERFTTNILHNVLHDDEEVFVPYLIVLNTKYVNQSLFIRTKTLYTDF